jgi:23S rRNA (cytosine1962-C5)-methyltransferase
MNFKHTGLFPEQAVNWDFIRETIRNSITRDGRPVRVLNLFAYTGGASAAAAAAGAEVCHVDAAKGMVSWAKENAAASSLSDKPIRWIVDDCREFVRREIRRGHQYEALIMDPPSYGRGPSGEIWKLEDDLFEFLSLCAPLLAQPPLFVLVNAYTTGLSPGAISYLMSSILIPRFGGAVLADELGLPVAQSHLNLPCGATGRWIPC